MSQKNMLPIKPMLWILVVLLAIVVWMPRPSNVQNPSSPSSPSGEELKMNNPLPQNNPSYGPTENVAAANGQNPILTQNTSTAGQTSTGSTYTGATNTESTNTGETTAAQIENTAGRNIAASAPTNGPVGTPANPIPTDAEALQRIALQNQQKAGMYALLAARTALAARIQGAAEATKYETVVSQNIAPANTTPAPQDVVDQIKSHKLVFQ